MTVGEGRPPRPRRRFGQHFLKDPDVIERIVAVIRPVAGQEIGPRPVQKGGQSGGTLT